LGLVQNGTPWLTKGVKRWIVSKRMGGAVVVHGTRIFDVKNIACLIAGGLILVVLSPLILAYVAFVALGICPKGFA